MSAPSVPTTDLLPAVADRELRDRAFSANRHVLKARAESSDRASAGPFAAAP
jgi:hypothetical protein